MPKLSCRFCDWFLTFSPATKDDAIFHVGAHYARCHDGMLEELHNFDPERLYSLPDTRQEVKS